MQSAVRSGIKKNNLCFCTKPRLKALGLEEQVVFPHQGGPGAEGSARAMLGAWRPFSPARSPPQISKCSVETTTKLVPGGGFTSACREDEDRQEVAVMGRENQAEGHKGARWCR